ncbi:uncharacterized protein F5891DRAFT_1190953 [Suillus fuscotomentosus]|uniref:Uncharacterized protein n=1 Tax=Suillus fuscotomentosus TaxID=1912939 RepID=A0AAD4E215_9AGAM|nr:uncharacterized protein F5891DRAFT_1190953 [Suillus fuscotomentosus]KAG1898285.1 hypothetical protein F5891DRAFT_1190953 [Suillus fuscotomentosus]
MSLRRAHSESIVEEQRKKCLKHHAVTVCKSLNLLDDALEAFASLNAEEKLNEIRGMLMSLCRTTKCNAAQEFIDSKDFEVTCLFVVAQLAITREILTSQRGLIKVKLMTSITNKTNISVLAKSLSSSGHEITVAHWARFSFLRSLLVNFIQIVDESARISVAQKSREASTAVVDPALLNIDDEECEGFGAADNTPRIWVISEYWEYIDLLLTDLRTESRKAAKASPVTSPVTSKGYLKDFFKNCLEADLKQYSAGCEGLKPAFEKVTVNWQRAIHNELVW